MGLARTARRLAGAVRGFLSSGRSPDNRELGAADRRQERDRLFEVFTLTGTGGQGGVGGTTPGGDPPRNLPGGRPDRDEDEASRR
jgi:hypothetical protein